MVQTPPASWGSPSCPCLSLLGLRWVCAPPPAEVMSSHCRVLCHRTAGSHTAVLFQIRGQSLGPLVYGLNVGDCVQTRKAKRKRVFRKRVFSYPPPQNRVIGQPCACVETVWEGSVFETPSAYTFCVCFKNVSESSASYNLSGACDRLC